MKTHDHAATMRKMESMERPQATDGRTITFIALLRGVAALLVIYSHLIGGRVEAYNIAWPPYGFVRGYITYPLGIIQNFGFFGVALFFLISGFIITHVGQRESRRTFLVKRLLRIYPPVIVAIVIVWALYHLDLYLTGTTSGIAQIPWPGVVLSMSLADVIVPRQTAVIAVGWTLTIEMLFYLHCLVLLPLIQKRPHRALMVFMGWAAIVTPVMLWLLRHTYHDTFGMLAIVVIYLPLFGIGMCCYYVWAQRVSLRFAVGMGCAAYLVFVHNLWQAFPLALTDGSYVTTVAYVVALFIACLCIGERLWFPTPLQFASQISYSLYLYHLPIGFFVMDRLYPRIGFNLALVIGLSSVGALSYVSWRYAEEPSQRWARSLLRQRRRPSLPIRGVPVQVTD